MRLFASLCLACLPLLTGCGSSLSGIGPNAPQPNTPKLTGNWQIQTAPQAGSMPPTLGVALFGALNSNGQQVTGTFRLVDFTSPNSCTPLFQTVHLSGSIDSSNQLTLTSETFSGNVAIIRLTLDRDPHLFPQGSIQVDGPTCSLPLTPAFGALFDPVNGSYSGTVTSVIVLGERTPTTATATLTLSQTTTPNPDGQFPVAGTLSFASTSCTVSTQVSGTASGDGLTLQSAVTDPFLLPDIRISAAGIGAPSQFASANADIDITNGPCGHNVYTGMLKRQ